MTGLVESMLSGFLFWVLRKCLGENGLQCSAGESHKQSITGPFSVDSECQLGFVSR